MLDLPIRMEEQYVAVQSDEPTIAGAVGFIGDLTGVIYVYAPVSLAKTMTAKLAGMELDEIEADEITNDSMGELTNMIVGHFKSRLSDRGNSCAMTIPSIVRGTNFCIEPVSTTVRRVFSFRSGDQQLVAEVMLKQEETSK
jgi:chemotaxis protein CheX